MDQPICSYPPCEHPARTKGYCSGHYAQQWKGQALRPLRRDKRTAGVPPKCTGPSCKRWVFAADLCNAHYLQRAKGLDLAPIKTRRTADGIPTPLIRDTEGRKRCTGCLEWLAEECFYTARREVDELTSRCKACQSLMQRATIARRHGITEAEYDALSVAQGGGCAICEKPCSRGSLSIDHDHNCCPTGDRSCGECIRGLLCRNCNIALGNMRDDPNLLRRAAGYLEQRMT